MLGSDQSSVESVTHVIQVALTPVFLLTAVAALLNVFSARLGRVADRVDHLSANLQRPMATDTEFFSAQLDHLRRRSFILDVAVVLATIAGVAMSGAALVLFVGALRETVVRSMLFVLFGGALDGLHYGRNLNYAAAQHPLLDRRQYVTLLTPDS